MWGAFGFALMTGLIYPPIYGFASSPRWVTGALLAIILFFAPRVRLGASHWIGLALLGWLLATLLWSEAPLDGVNAAFHLVILVIAFAVGSMLDDLRPLVIGSALGIGVSSGIVIAQRLGVVDIEQYGGCCGGLFYNRNNLAAAAALVAIGTVALRRLWPLLPLLLPSLLLAPSRGAWLALIVGWMAMSRYAKWWLAFGIFVAVAVGLYAPLYTITLDPSTNERLMIWHDTIANLTLFGHGLGSFRDVFVQIAHAFDIAVQHTRPEHPHNEWLWLAFEGGIPAFVGALLLALALWHESADRPERGILAGFFVLSLFALPFQDPATAIMGSLCAGYLAGQCARVRDATYDRRSALRAGLAHAVGRGGIG